MSWFGGRERVVPKSRIDKVVGKHEPIMGGSKLVEAFKRVDVNVCEEYFDSSTGTNKEIAKQLAQSIRQDAQGDDISEIIEKIEQSQAWVGPTYDKLKLVADELKGVSH